MVDNQEEEIIVTSHRHSVYEMFLYFKDYIRKLSGRKTGDKGESILRLIRNKVR